MASHSAVDSFLIITGPTAVGKTSVSIALAAHLGAEIISSDSRQVYKEMCIGTAKPDAALLSEIPHHFIDELHVGESFSAGAFAKQAYARIQGILDRGRVPLVVGGSTLYLHALQFGLADIPEIPEAIRLALQHRLEQEGSAVLYDELRDVDPASAATLDPSKTQRLLRALEVYLGTGKPLSFFHQQQTPPPYPFRMVVLHRERNELYARIDARVDSMLEQGLISEVQSILDLGITPTERALRTIGYQEVIAHLQGTINYEEMVRRIKRNTRRYAKRQRTWFRRYPQATWVHADDALAKLIAGEHEDTIQK